MAPDTPPFLQLEIKLSSSVAESEGFVTNDSRDVATSALVGVATGAVLLAEHVALWPLTELMTPGDEIAPLFPYIVGSATVAAGQTVLAQIRPLKWWDLWVGLIIGGGIVATARIYRRWLRYTLTVERENGHAHGQVEGARTYGETYRRRGALN